MDDLDDLEVNIKHRWNHYCRAVNPKNQQICSLYNPHEGGHKPKHGTEADRWFD